jgi:hypothetical protein
MKIALLNDFKEYAGAEVSQQQRIQAKPEELTVDFFVPGDLIEFEKYDGFVLENIVMFKSEVLHNIIDDRPYVKVEHDFNFCIFRNQIQCKTCDQICPVQSNPMIKALYENAKLVIAASPAHMNFQKQLLAGWNINYTYGLPYTYKKTAFKIPDVKRIKKTVAYMGTLRAFKGLYEVIRLAEDRKDYHFDIAGRHGQIKGRLPPNVSHVGFVDDKWKYLASHEYFIHVPRFVDPCPGTVIEAILAGCKLIYNDNVGTLSYPFKNRKEWVEALDAAGTVFWKRVTNSFNND